MKTKFSEFLAEGVNAKPFDTSVISNIQNNLNICIKNKTFLFRGARGASSKFSGTKSVKRTRRSSATGNNFSLYAFYEFFKEFPDRFKSTFVTNDFDNASGFSDGGIYVVIPFDDTKTYGEALDDFNTDINKVLSSFNDDANSKSSLNSFTANLRYFYSDLEKVAILDKTKPELFEGSPSFSSNFFDSKILFYQLSNRNDAGKDDLKKFAESFFKFLSELEEWYNKNKEDLNDKKSKLHTYLNSRWIYPGELVERINLFLKIKDKTEKEFNGSFYDLLKSIYSPENNRFRLLKSFDEVIASAKNKQQIEFWFKSKYAFFNMAFFSDQIALDLKKFAPLLDKYKIEINPLTKPINLLNEVDAQIYLKVFRKTTNKRIGSFLADFFKIFLES